MPNRYIIPSSDVIDTFNDGSPYWTTRSYVVGNAVNFCSDCGAIVYRTDLHDSWHKQIEQVSRNAKGIRT